jgi:hypothetical protein
MSESIVPDFEHMDLKPNQTLVFGYSDDLIEFRGATYDEVDCFDAASVLLTFSNGTVLKVVYGMIWSITVVSGEATVVYRANEDDDDHYTDAVIVDGSLVSSKINDRK